MACLTVPETCQVLTHLVHLSHLSSCFPFCLEHCSPDTEMAHLSCYSHFSSNAVSTDRPCPDHLSSFSLVYFSSQHLSHLHSQYSFVLLFIDHFHPLKYNLVFCLPPHPSHLKNSSGSTHACLVAQLCPTLCDPIDCMQPARLLCPWDSSGKNTGVSCHSLLQGIFLTQGANSCLLHCGWILYHLSHQGSPQISTAAAAAAKSLQLCPTLCDPIDGSPPGSPVPGILQARTPELVAISFSNA